MAALDVQFPGMKDAVLAVDDARLRCKRPSIPSTSSSEFEQGPPTEFFKAPIASGGPRGFAFHYDVAPDGERFLVLVRPQSDSAESSPLTVVLNWQRAVKR